MADKTRVLVVDDEPGIRFVLEKALAKAGFEAVPAASAEEARQLLLGERFPVMLLDVRLPGDSGFRLLEELRGRPGSPRVVVMTAEDTLRAGVTAMGLGADEYLTKPFDLPRLAAVVRELAKRGPTGTRPPTSAPAAPGLVGVSPAMVELSKQVGRAAASSLTVLVTGESGTGKELVARAIHEHSPRAGAPFVTVNAAAIPRELVESELYGHEKGAFTSATARHEGRFEQADGGTLFLDEIGELPLDAQAKLLRAIQERSIDRVGGRSRAVDVRLVAATNADLAGLVESGAFRADLYWRLSVLVLRIPPLRERPEDLEPLAAHFLAKHAPALVGRSITLGEGAERALRAHPWPGNVRELENAVQRALVSCTGDVLSGDALEVAIRAVASPGGSGGAGLPIDDVPDGRAYAEVMERAERRILEAAMTRFGGNQVQAARWLGIHRNTLRTRLAALGLSPRDEV